ncbi:3D domain protein [Paenibacillus algicola]|uniref:3D domain protein n=1 Tax=Paenibacillus algicola TaxID=2565926 RepID=A0A4P8XK76_9BACL|nr:3D domain protein [Paenibacillus algicola]
MNRRLRNKRMQSSKALKWFTAAIMACTMTAGLAIPKAEAARIHTAKQGDTFYLLSKQYNVNLTTLMKENPSIHALNIYPGLKITIPGISAKPGVFVPSLNVFPDQKIVEAWGKTFSYSKTLGVRATAYSSDAAENGGWGAVDYFGNPLVLGTIAVDPKVIPLGTKVLVTGHAHPGLPKKAFVAVARDIGGAIKGNKIDIFIPGSQQSVRMFGFQDIKLYFIQ